MDDSARHSETKSQVAEEKPRDSEGHFVHIDHPTQEAAATTPPQHQPNPISQFLHDETVIHSTNKDELVDIHVGNPLKKIQTLLEEIKKQKAFTFDIKGSLGVAGIVLVLGTFGVFGGTKALCNKGSLSKIGVIQTLTYEDRESNFFTRYIPFAKDFLPERTSKRMVLITDDKSVIRLHFKENAMSATKRLLTIPYLVTGDFDSCSQSLAVDSPFSLQPYNY